MVFDPNSKDSRSQRSLREVLPQDVACIVQVKGSRPLSAVLPLGRVYFLFPDRRQIFRHTTHFLFLLSQQTLGPHHFPINGYLFRKCKLFLILTNCRIIRVRGCHELNIRRIALLPELRGEASPRTHMAVQTFSTSQGHSGDLGLVNQSAGTGDAVLG